MWRIFNNIPRTFRQHFHGPRASTNLHSEEERCDTAARCECVEHSPGCRDAQHGTPCLQAGGQHVPPGGAAGREGGRQEDHWRTCHSDFWSLFHGQRTCLEAVTWGTVVALGLQLSHWDWRQWCRDRHQDSHSKRQAWPYRLLCRVAFAGPGSWGLTGHTVLPSQPSTLSQPSTASPHLHSLIPDVEDADQTPAKGGCRAASGGEAEDHFGAVVTELHQLSRKATALERSLTGLQLASLGDLQGATTQLQTASRLGHHPASFNLALCYQQGHGVEHNLHKAVELYRSAATGGHAQAQYNLALLILEGTVPGMTPDLHQASCLLEQAATQGLAQAQTYLGVLYMEEALRNTGKAVSLFRQAAAQNDAEAQFFLGMCYEQGWGVDCSDCEAARWYQQAAEQGHPQALYNLAVFTQHGLGGVVADQVEARRLYQQAREAGHEPLQSDELPWLEVQAGGKEGDNPLQLRQKGDDSSRRSLSPSLSTPTLSDLLHCQLTELVSGELWFSPQPYPAPRSPTQSPSPESQEVRFFLGGDEEEAEALGNDGCDVALDKLGLTPSRLSFGSFQRHSTMPNLQSVACP